MVRAAPSESTRIQRIRKKSEVILSSLEFDDTTAHRMSQIYAHKLSMARRLADSRKVAKTNGRPYDGRRGDGSDIAARGCGARPCRCGASSAFRHQSNLELTHECIGFHCRADREGAREAGKRGLQADDAESRGEGAVFRRQDFRTQE